MNSKILIMLIISSKIQKRSIINRVQVANIINLKLSTTCNIHLLVILTHRWLKITPIIKLLMAIIHNWINKQCIHMIQIKSWGVIQWLIITIHTQIFHFKINITILIISIIICYSNSKLRIITLNNNQISVIHKLHPKDLNK